MLKVFIINVYIKFLFFVCLFIVQIYYKVFVFTNFYSFLFVPRVGLEPTRLSTYAPKAYVSTIPPPGQVVFFEQIPGIEPGFHPYQGCIITNYMITAFVLLAGFEPARSP